MKRWAIQLTLHFEMESDTEDGPGEEEAITEIKRRVPGLDRRQLDFEYSEELG